MPKKTSSASKKNKAPTDTVAANPAKLQRAAVQSGPTNSEGVPPIVGEVLNTSGQPLDSTTRATMETRFGHDFSGVRVHTDPDAAASALAINASAYTVGQDVVFGPGQYAPDSSAGMQLLAHELSHVSQNPTPASSASLRLGAPDSLQEQQAYAASQQVAHGRGVATAGQGASHSQAEANVVHRSILGGILGGIGGAIGGAVIGGLLGGPIGAIVGGVVGLVGGALIANAATTRSRSLTADEIKYAHDVFLDSVDYSKITITRDSLLAAGAPRTIGNTINLKSEWGHFKGDTLELTEQGMITLIHEMGHVWQYQHGGLEYIPDSLIAQLKASIGGGSRNAAYDWRAQVKAGVPWEEWNPEQQAEAIEDYNKLLRKCKTPEATPEDFHELAVLQPYIDKVRRGEGAPGDRPSSTPTEGPLL